MSESPLTDAERAKRQGARLKGLRERMGLSKGRLMDALRLKTTNGYDMYERGQSVIRFDRVQEWADAFGITPEEFALRVLSDDDAYDFHGELERVLPDDPDEVEHLYRKYARWPAQNQRIVVELLDDRRELDTRAPDARAIAEECAQYTA